MLLSIQGYVSYQRRLFSEALQELSENGEQINHVAYEKIEHGLDEARCTTLTLYDLVMALLKGDISKDEAVTFLCLDAEKLENHKHTNDLITFTPSTDAKD